MPSLESNEPAFLRRLRGEVGGQDTARHERAIPRPKKRKDLNNDEDDGPTYVDEDRNEVLNRSEYEALVDQRNSEKAQADDVAQVDNQSSNQAASLLDNSAQGLPSMEKVASIGSSSRKRLAKAVGEEETELMPHVGKDLQEQKMKPTMRKPKKIKLSFEDERGSPGV